MNSQHMYDMSTPTHPDHLADVTAGMRVPARSATSDDFVARTFDEVEMTQAEKPIRPTYIAGSRTDPYGMRFPWGPVIEVHQIANYTILEYLEDLSRYDQPELWYRHGRTLYYVYVDGKSTNVSALSMDAALVGAIAYRRDGANSRAGDYFMRMVGGGD